MVEVVGTAFYCKYRRTLALEDGKHATAPSNIDTCVQGSVQRTLNAHQIRCVCGVALDTAHTDSETLSGTCTSSSRNAGRWGSISCFTGAQGCIAHESVTQLTAGHSCEARRYQPSSAGRMPGLDRRACGQPRASPRGRSDERDRPLLALGRGRPCTEWCAWRAARAWLGLGLGLG